MLVTAILLTWVNACLLLHAFKVIKCGGKKFIEILIHHVSMLTDVTSYYI
jgi:hypothetical protein